MKRLKQTGKNLKAIRESRGLSGIKVADIMGSSLATIYNAENKGITTVEMLFRFCEALGCEPNDVLSDDVDLGKFSSSADITTFYPWNLAYAVMVGQRINIENTQKANEEIYKVYVPGLIECLNKLTGREKDVLELRYLHGLTLEQTGKRFDLTRERIRQIESRAMRKLRHPTFRKLYLLDTVGKVFEIDAEKTRLERENAELRKLLYEEGKLNEVEDIPLKAITIEDLELSIRPYNCLLRAGIKDLYALSQMTFPELMKVRNMGKKSAYEVAEKVRKFGVKIPYERECD